MRSALLLVLACAVIVGTGCGGGDACQRLTSAIASKSKACPEADVRGSTPAAETEECSTALKACTPADIKLFDDWATCVEKLPACVAGKESTWDIGYATCGMPALKASQPCLDSMHTLSK